MVDSIDYKFSDRAGSIASPASMAMAQRVRMLKADGIRVIDFTTGEPDFDTPHHIKEAAWKALLDGHTHYSASRGNPELLEAVAGWYASQHGLDIEASRQVIITPGAKQAILLTCLALLNAGDEVLIPEPCWLSYGDMVRMAGGVPVFVKSDISRGFIVDEEDLERRVSERTRAVMINSPCNPTGAVWDPGPLRAVGAVARRHDLMVISDEIYDRIVYDDVEASCMAALDDLAGRTVVINGFSKTYAMTGWRIGYLIAPVPVVDAIMPLHQNSATCVASFVQSAALAALTGSQECVAEMVREYQARRDLLESEVGRIPGLSCPSIAGTFYAMLDIRSLHMTSQAAAEFLLESAGVATTPGSAYGASGEGYLRLAFPVAREEIREGMERIAEAVQRKE